MDKIILWFVIIIEYLISTFKIIKIRKYCGFCFNRKNCDYLVCENYCNLFNKTIVDFTSLHECNKKCGLTYIGK